MANPVVVDYLQSYPFWLMDIGPSDLFSFPVLSPWFGFSTITAPEITLETEEIREANFPYPTKVVKYATNSSMTLTRGVSVFDSDFWRWMATAVSGNTKAFQPVVGQIPGLSSLEPGVTYRRDLLLIHHFSRSPFGDSFFGLGLRGMVELLVAGLVGYVPTGGATAALSSAVGALGGAQGGEAVIPRMPAKLYKLHGCIPLRYKVGSDFDATSSAVSIQEIDIDVEEVIEYGLLA